MGKLSGTKLDAFKPRLGLVPTPAIRVIAWVLTFGEIKYASWNWAGGFEWSRLIDSLKRHIDDFVNCKDYDDESGFLSLANAGCCLVFLIVHQLLGLGRDNRFNLKAGKTMHDLRGTKPLPSHRDGDENIPAFLANFKKEWNKKK